MEMVKIILTYIEDLVREITIIGDNEKSKNEHLILPMETQEKINELINILEMNLKRSK